MHPSVLCWLGLDFLDPQGDHCWSRKVGQKVGLVPGVLLLTATSLGHYQHLSPSIYLISRIITHFQDFSSSKDEDMGSPRANIVFLCAETQCIIIPLIGGSVSCIFIKGMKLLFSPGVPAWEQHNQVLTIFLLLSLTLILHFCPSPQLTPFLHTLPKKFCCKAAASSTW